MMLVSDVDPESMPAGAVGGSVVRAFMTPLLRFARAVRSVRFGLATKVALGTAVIGTAAMTAITIYLYQGSIAAIAAREQFAMASALNTVDLRLNGRFGFARNDVVFLSTTLPVTGIMRARANGGSDPIDGSSEEMWRTRLAALFSAMLESRPEYMRLRYIGVTNGGREIVRVDRSIDGEIRRMPEAGLQSEADRPYFAETTRFLKGEVYTSEIELNREFGEIEKPHRPIIRMATQVYDESGALPGTLVVDIDMRRLFGLMNATFAGERLHYFTNQDGDYVEHPDSSKAFGFELGHRYRIQDDLPELSSLFEGGDPVYSGFVNFSKERHLVSAQRIAFDPRDPKRYLTVVELRPESILLGDITALRNRSALAALGFLVAGMIAVTWLARMIVRPLRVMTDTATRLAHGDRRIDLGAMTRRRDETGELARAFDAMVHQVESREAELTAHAAELTRSNQELSQFAYVASHDLQEPLRMVASYLELLSRRFQGKLDAEADEFIGYAVDGAERMKLLINDLLGYSRVSNASLNLETVSTASVANAVVKVLADRVNESGAEITIESLPNLRADPTMIERLLMNLVDNALKYRSSLPPRIRIASERKDDFWKFSVTDNGIGIDPKFVRKIFEIFTRLHSREKYSGTGIGLASCKRIVERHGGEIWVEPAPGGGSSFFFTLPA